METVFDWLTVAIFAAIAVLFLQRSMQDEPTDTMWHYLPPTIGCAIANQLGNNGYVILAVALMMAVLMYLVYLLKPFQSHD
ncbi:XrtV sorting system accessory protein [Novosphingobium sp. M1R2S20]|uniref:XrtV sorting system accessory protein n=1 Tax=Novosphingobium rhizovicinum TaxID=3228928 RepID=A0ABV3R9S5_9SPHN